MASRPDSNGDYKTQNGDKHNVDPDVNTNVDDDNDVDNILNKKFDNLSIESIESIDEKKYIKKILTKVDSIFDNFKDKLFREEAPKTYLPTIYEEAAGMSYDKTKNFQNFMGKFMEDICGISDKYKKLKQDGKNGGNDGILLNSIFCEIKSKYITMKGSLVDKELLPKIKYAIENKKGFYLLVINDRNNESRDIPLHKGNACAKIKNIDGYNETEHRWISGDNIYKLLFDDIGIIVQKRILKLLKNEKTKREHQ